MARSRLADPKEHDDLLNYQLKRLAKWGGAPAIRVCEGRFGVTRQEWRVLAALVESGAMTSSSLADRCHLERAVVSRQVGVLVGKRLVCRLPRGPGRPRVEVEATPEGRALYSGLFPQLAAINRRLIAVLDADEAEQLERLLDKLWARARLLRDVDLPEDHARADRRHGGSRTRWAATKGKEG